MAKFELMWRLLPSINRQITATFYFEKLIFFNNQ